MATEEAAKTLSALTLTEGFGSENVGETAEGQKGNLTSGSGADRGVEVDNVSVLCEFAENRGVCVNTETFGADIVIEGQKFGPSNVKDLSEEAQVIVGSGFSEKNSDKMGTTGISLFVDLSHNNSVGKCDRVEYADDEENGYKVGDFVWSKFNSHPWWPAHIYDHSDASDQAKKCRPRGNFLLIAYFGDGSFSWRSPSQLKPFSEHFDDLSKKNDSGIFLDSVQSALDEIERVAQLKMTCHCISKENKAGLNKERTINSGIKDGVIGPDCDFERLPVSNFEPYDFLLKLREIALGESGVNTLELTGLRSYVSAFNLARGGRKFGCFYDNLAIEGMKDLTRRGIRKGSFLHRCDDLTKKRKFVKSGIVTISGNEVLSDENGHGEEMTLSRKRKKSRYLSYPYTDPYLSVNLTGTERDFVAESVKISEFAGVVNVKGAIANASSEEVVTEAQAAALDPRNFFKSNSSYVVNDFIRAYRTGAYANGSNEKTQKKKQNSLGSKSKAGLGLKSRNKTCDEMVTISEMMDVGEKPKRGREIKIDGHGNNKELLFIKEKLEKMSKMVANCDGSMLSEMKISLEIDINELLENLRAMMNIASP